MNRLRHGPTRRRCAGRTGRQDRRAAMDTVSRPWRRLASRAPATGSASAQEGVGRDEWTARPDRLARAPAQPSPDPPRPRPRPRAASPLASSVLALVLAARCGRDERGERAELGVVEDARRSRRHELLGVAVGDVVARVGDALEVVVEVLVERVQARAELALGADRGDRVAAVAALVGEQRAAAAHAPRRPRRCARGPRRPAAALGARSRSAGASPMPIPRIAQPMTRRRRRAPARHARRPARAARAGHAARTATAAPSSANTTAHTSATTITSASPS